MKNLIGVATLQLYRKIYAFSEKVVNMFSTRFYPKFSNLVILARGHEIDAESGWRDFVSAKNGFSLFLA